MFRYIYKITIHWIASTFYNFLQFPFKEAHFFTLFYVSRESVIEVTACNSQSVYCYTLQAYVHVDNSLS